MNLKGVSDIKRTVRFAALVAALVMSLTLCVSAASYSDADSTFTVEIGSDYTVLRRDNLSKNKDFIEHLGSSVENFGKQMDQSGIKLYAATEDNSRQIQLRVWQSDFSKDIGSLSKLSDEQLAIVREKLPAAVIADGELKGTDEITASGAQWFCCTVKVDGTAQAADGEALGYCMREYITVSGGKFYALIYYNSSDELSAAELKEAGDVFASLKLKSEGSSRASGGYILLMRIVAAVLIVVAAVVAVFIISTFVRDIRLKKDSPEVIPEHIKMHRK